jgi:hypothetical protein
VPARQRDRFQIRSIRFRGLGPATYQHAYNQYD